MRLARIKIPLRLSFSMKLAGALLLYFAIYLRDSVSHLFPSSIFLLALACGTLVLALHLNGRVSRNDALIVYTFSILLIINSGLQSGIQFSNYLVAPIAAFFAAKVVPRVFTNLLIFHMLVSILIQGYEHISGDYLFVTVAEDGTELTSKFFGGAVGVFRAKGMFQGPLSAVGFYLLMAILIPGLRIPILSFIGSLMAYGRLGILISTALIVNELYASSGSKARIFIVTGIPIAAAFAAPAVLQGSFFISAFDLSSSGNLARLYYWSESVALYSSYDIWALLFGDLGYVNEVLSGTESDFLRILLDCGFSTLLIYFLALRRLYLAIRRERQLGSVVFWIMVATMNIFPFIQSLNTAVVFWFIFWLKTGRKA